MEENKEEVIKGKSKGFGAVGLIVFVVLGVLFISFLGFQNPFISFFGFLLAAFIFYIILGNLHNYSIYTCKIEVNYPFRKVKNMVILKEEIKVVKYITIKDSDILMIYYIKGQRKGVVSLRIRDFDLNVQETSIYRILRKIKGWGVGLEMESGRKEIIEILK